MSINELTLLDSFAKIDGLET